MYTVCVFHVGHLSFFLTPRSLGCRALVSGNKCGGSKREMVLQKRVVLEMERAVITGSSARVRLMSAQGEGHLSARGIRDNQMRLSGSVIFLFLLLSNHHNPVRNAFFKD